MNILGVFVKIYKGFRYMSFDMWRVVAVFYFSWYGASVPFSPATNYKCTITGQDTLLSWYTLPPNASAFLCFNRST